MAEWLGKGLQSPVRRFDSGSRLFVIRNQILFREVNERVRETIDASGGAGRVLVRVQRR